MTLFFSSVADNVLDMLYLAIIDCFLTMLLILQTDFM